MNRAVYALKPPPHRQSDSRLSNARTLLLTDGHRTACSAHFMPSLPCMHLNGRNERPAVQPWRSQRVQEKHDEEASTEQRQRQDHHRQNGRRHQHAAQQASTSSISSWPMRQARMKPPGVGSGGVPLELLSSPSRGLDAGSDPSRDLTQRETQHRFRKLISQRLSAHSSRHGPVRKPGTELFAMPRPDVKGNECAATLDKEALQSLQEIMLLVRRLREGCVAAARADGFTLDVYLLSTLLSIIIGDNIQLSSSLPRLVDLYEREGRDSIERGRAPGQQANSDIHNLLHGSSSSGSADTAVDLDLARSLLLIWLSISGGRAERVGGRKVDRRLGKTLAYHECRHNIKYSVGPYVQLAGEVNAALAQDNVLALRSLLLATRSQVWLRALLRRTVEGVRVLVWNTLGKAYLHLSVDSALLGSPDLWPSAAGPSDWLERMLMIDVEVMPPTADELSRKDAITVSKESQETRDEWDDSVEEIAADLQAASLTGDKLLNSIRADRIAAALHVYGLPEAAPDTDGLGLERWRGRVVKQAGAPVIKLR